MGGCQQVEMPRPRSLRGRSSATAIAPQRCVLNDHFRYVCHILLKYGYAPQKIVPEFITTEALAVTRSRYADFCRASSSHPDGLFIRTKLLTHPKLKSIHCTIVTHRNICYKLTKYRTMFKQMSRCLFYVVRKLEFYK